MAQEEFVPRLNAIVEVLLDERGTLRVMRGNSPELDGEVLIDLVFGRKDKPSGSWTAYLVRTELDPHRNEVCIQAGLNLHMNRTIAFGARDWEEKLIDAFEWLLSDSMRPHLRISN